jgi:hypothetical protein
MRCGINHNVRKRKPIISIAKDNAEVNKERNESQDQGLNIITPLCFSGKRRVAAEKRV